MPKPNLCSFCGNQAERTLLGKYTCSVKKCPGYFVECSLKDWNTRPIEDALNARIAELEAMHDHQHLLDLADEMAKLQAENAKLKEQIVTWHKYPDEKPIKQDWYLTSYKGEIRRHFWVGGCIGFDTNPTDIPYISPLQPQWWAYLPAPPEEEK